VTYRFTGGTDGNSPTGPLAFANGILYGATASGGGSGCGGNGCGTVFAVDLATGAETVLHRFTGGADGANPVPGVTYACGILYGAAASGGAAGAGTVFRIDPATGRFTLLHGLGGAAEGAYPNEVIYHRGHLYAATQQGGGSGVGVVFDINLRTRAETVLLDFPGGAGGGLPLRSPIFAHGMLYGTTGFGGAHGVGVLYKLNPATGVETVLHTFDGADGSWIVGPTYQAGTFYGPTAQGGSFGYGTVYKFAP